MEAGQRGRHQSLLQQETFNLGMWHILKSDIHKYDFILKQITLTLLFYH